MLILPYLDRETTARIRMKMKGNRGRAYVIIHPYCYGITEAESEAGLVRAEANGGLTSPDLRFRASAALRNELYTLSFEKIMATSPDPVMFVFEAVADERAPIEALMTDARLIAHVERLKSIVQQQCEIVIVPTRTNGADPILFPRKYPYDPTIPDSVVYNRWEEDQHSRRRGWRNTLRVMRWLGLRRASLGGCFLAVSNGMTVNKPYSCVNHLGGEIHASRLFKWDLVEDLIYAEEVPPPAVGLF